MEDFLKNKLSDYEPTFKEAYWTEMSAKLNKRSRRKRLIFLILSGTSAVVAISLIWSIIYINRNQVPTASPQEIAMNHQKTSHSIEDKQLHQTGEEKSTLTSIVASLVDDQEGTSLNEIAEQHAKKSVASLNAQSNTLINRTRSKKTSSKNKQYRATQASTEDSANTIFHQPTLNNFVNPIDNQTASASTSKAIADILNEHIFPSNHESKSNIEKNPPGIMPRENLNNRTANRPSRTDVRTQHTTQFVAVAVQSLEQPSISLFDRQVSLPTLSPLEQVKINITSLDNSFMAMAFQIGAGLVSNSSDDLIYEHHIQLKRYVKFDNSMLYAAIGLAAGRYQGTFQAIDHEQVSYRTFAENLINQSLIPKDLYYLSLPLEFGVTQGKLNVGINISPEYLLAVHGDVVTSVQSNTVTSTPGIGEPLEFSVTQNRSIQKKSTWLDDENIKSFNYSYGLIAGYRVEKHWHISLSGHYYPNDLYLFKRTIRSSNSITGRKTNLKGRLHVAYIF